MSSTRAALGVLRTLVAARKTWRAAVGSAMLPGAAKRWHPCRLAVRQSPTISESIASVLVLCDLDPARHRRHHCLAERASPHGWLCTAGGVGRVGAVATASSRSQRDAGARQIGVPG